MPYRPVHLTIGQRTETLWSRISDEATMAWLAERPYLRSRGYPDRPPDVDTPTVRLWIARPSEERLPYFRDRVREAAGGTFPVYSVSWQAPDGSGAKVVVTGLPDGSLLSRVMLEDESGTRTVDKAHRYPPEDDPDDIWDAVTRIVGFIDAFGGWEGEPLMTDYADFLALEAEVEAAKADARAAGLLEERRLDA